jgi:hypothetical protein
MAPLQRSKASSPEGQTARFLYSVLKQLNRTTLLYQWRPYHLQICNFLLIQVPPTPRFNKAAPSFVFADRTATAIVVANEVVTDIKAEFDLMGCPVHPAGDQPLVKNEPIDA